MSRDLGPCPAPNTLERLLAERLSGTDRETVESHVENCTICQERLEELSTQPPHTSARPTMNGPEPEPSADFLRRLRETTPRPDGSGPPTNHLDDFPIWFEHGRVGQYEVLERLGKGGMGTVYKARHVELGKVVALKVMPADQMDEVRVGRFKNEVRAIGRLNHPHIVAAHDAGEAGGVHYLVMDYVDGEDLGRVVGRHGRLPIPDACEAVRQAALGLQHAFECQLVHRDIKPSNLILTRAGCVQLLDLGLARSFGDRPAERLTADGMVLGTADYLAPEQWEHAHAADIRADIYSLGCTLYHLIAGKPPFAGRRYASLLQKLRGHVDTPYPPVTEARPEVPAGLVAVLDRMLAKAPADRFATPAEVAEALRPFAVGADLRGLLDATATGPLLPDEAAVTPNAAMLDTAHGSDRGRTARARRRYARPLALAGLFAATAIAAVAVWPRAERPEVPATPPVAADRPAGPATPPVTVDELRVNHYRGKQGPPLGDIRLTSTDVRVGDAVRVFVRLSAPAYCYLIAFNPDGTEQLCHPAWDGDNPQRARAVRPEKGTEIRFFPDDRGVFGLDSRGLQVFVLVASTQPLPPYAEWQVEAGKAAWKPVPHGGAWGWEYDGHEFNRLPLDRGSRQEREGEPEALKALCEFFKNRPGLEALRIIAFPVSGNGT